MTFEEYKNSPFQKKLIAKGGVPMILKGQPSKIDADTIDDTFTIVPKRSVETFLKAGWLTEDKKVKSPVMDNSDNGSDLETAKELLGEAAQTISEKDAEIQRLKALLENNTDSKESDKDVVINATDPHKVVKATAKKATAKKTKKATAKKATVKK